MHLRKTVFHEEMGRDGRNFGKIRNWAEMNWTEWYILFPL